VKLNSTGEVIDLATLSQFLAGRTEFACGFVAAALQCYAGAPGAGVRASLGTIDAWWLQEYSNQYGSNGANMDGGVSIPDMHRLITKALPNSGSSHYLDIVDIGPNSVQASDIACIHGALDSGYPVIVTVPENTVFDVGLGANPYWWGAAGSHIFTITGYHKDTGDYIVHDPANVTGALQGNNVPRPQPRTYRASALGIHWACMIRQPWLAPFPAGWNPKTGAKLNQLSTATHPKPAPDKPLVRVYDKSVATAEFNAYADALWSGTGVTYPKGGGIYNSWLDHLVNHDFKGVPLNAEQKNDASGKPLVNVKGNPIALQHFSKASCSWDLKDNVATWL